MLYHADLSTCIMENTLFVSFSKFKLRPILVAFIVIFPVFLPLYSYLNNSFGEVYQFCGVKAEYKMEPIINMTFLTFLSIINIFQCFKVYRNTFKVPTELYDIMMAELTRGPGIYALLALTHTILSNIILFASVNVDAYHKFEARVLLTYLFPLIYGVTYYCQKEYLVVSTYINTHSVIRK
jgi:hypothetical protein